MATVDGYTKSGLDALLATKSAVGHTHDPVPGSGSGILVTSAYASTLFEFAGSGTSTCVAPGGWGFETPADNVLSGITSSDGFGWGYAEAGWYQVQFRFWLQLAGSTENAMTAEFTDYADQASCEWELPMVDGGDGSLGRLGIGCKMTVTSPVYYSEASDVTGDDQGAHQLILRWIGGGTLSNGNGSGPNYAVMMRIAKLG